MSYLGNGCPQTCRETIDPDRRTIPKPLAEGIASDCNSATRRPRQALAAYGLSAIGTHSWPSGAPVYSARGRISLLFRYCSRIWAVQPDMRLTANTGVNRSTGMPKE